MKQVYRHYLWLFHNFSGLRTGSCVATGPAQKEAVAQFVVPECLVSTVWNLVHDTVVAGHPGSEPERSIFGQLCVLILTCMWIGA